MTRDTNSEEPEGPLTLSELLRSELYGKHVATSRYDTLIWRIRSGYVLVLYGALTLLVGKELDATALRVEHLVLMFAFSLIGFVMDATYRIRQLRVVVARDRMIDQAFRIAQGNEPDLKELAVLIHISGESHDIQVPAARVWRVYLALFAFYAATPLLALFASIYLGG